MAVTACAPCELRFAPSARSLCPECERPLVTLHRAEQAVGLRLFAAPDRSLRALEAAIAALPKTRSPPHG